MTKEKGTVAVIFVSKRAATDPDGYGMAANAMMETAAKFPGYRGVHSARRGWHRHHGELLGKRCGRPRMEDGRRTRRYARKGPRHMV
jgi:hypothetical protein